MPDYIFGNNLFIVKRDLKIFSYNSCNLNAE